MANVDLAPTSAVKGEELCLFVCNSQEANESSSQSCQGTCNAKAECGKYAAKGDFECPLNVCCSQYGFCGTTDEFCNDKCQNEGGCMPVLRPKSCDSSSDAMDSEVRIAYYGAWGASRDCNRIQPENIPAGVLTHINVAFEYVSEDFEITDENKGVVARTARLKRTYEGLRVNIAIGGWVFNDAPTQHRFSDMVSTVPNREKFINSLIKYIQKYGLDGVDLDWEYPVAEDRGGVDEDYDNFVLLCSEIREAFDSVDPGWQLTLTLPSSYWYLKGFDIQRLEKYVNWFNVMSYDIHGLWDKTIKWTGPYLKGHTNLTEIEEGLDLLWRNGISSSKVVMGYGFYGRGFTMKDPNCNKPPSCKFSGASFPGDCTNEAGILSYSEIKGHREQLGTSKPSYDKESTVKWMIYGSNEWISFDDAETFKHKKEYQSSRCLKGFMIWSLDLDTPNFDAMHDFFGDKAMANALGDTSLKPDEKEKLVEDLSAYTGQNCYVTTKCTQGGNEKDSSAECGPGYKSIELGHAPWQMKQGMTLNSCKEGEYHHICCPTKHAPSNCEWVGGPEQSEFGCSRGCGDSQFELTTDGYTDYKGKGNCYTGRTSLCCDSTDIVNDYLCDFEDGKLRSFCCPKKDPLENCAWGNDATKVKNHPSEKWWQSMYTCANKKCTSQQLAVTHALVPHTSIDWVKEDAVNCADYPSYPGTSPEYPLCCDPPSKFDDDWPVQPSFLWSDRAPDDEADVTWEWANNFGNNNHDITSEDLDDNPGADPYGFVMLDGPPGSINNAFDEDFTVVQRDEPQRLKRRSLVTSNRTILHSVFEHSEETIRVYCNHPADSQNCRRTFYKGAKDTIIRLPAHVGEGPWARIISMEPEYEPDELPSWVLHKRAVTDNLNGIYKLKIDYNFHLIERDDDPVNMRVDYTNLKTYWDDITDEPVDKKKRSTWEPVPHRSFDEWRNRLERAKVADKRTRRSVEQHQSTVSFSPDQDLTTRDSGIGRRWFGPFKEWLKKLNNVKQEDSGVLPMGLTKYFTLYSGRLHCENDAGVTMDAGLDVTADLGIEMNTRYSYYFSGTVVPPKIIDTYAFVGAQPEVIAGITIKGDASLRYQTRRKKLIDTLTYPGLAIKGIAAVGPSFDLWGQLDGEVLVRGQMRVGARYSLEPIEMYMPNDDETRQKANKTLEENYVNKTVGLEPEFQANVKAEVKFDILVTPEINMGIKVGGGLGSFKKSLVDAHVSAFVNTTLQFYAEAMASTGLGESVSWSYEYGVKLFYRVGFAAIAEIIFYGEWRTKAYFPFSLQEIDLYGPKTVKSSTAEKKRSLPLFAEQDGPLSDPIFKVPSGMSSTSDMALGIRQDMPEITWNASSHLQRREAKDTEFEFGVFKCTKQKGQRCQPRSVQLDKKDLSNLTLAGHDLEKRQDSDEDDSDDDDSDNGKYLRPQCVDEIPSLYYNCMTYFADYTFSIDTSHGGTGRSITLPGICSSINRFTDNWYRMAGSIRSDNPSICNEDGCALTWDSDQPQQGSRRNRACPGQKKTNKLTQLRYCHIENRIKQKQVFAHVDTDTTDLINCDEFPFASTEQGGDGFYGLHPDDILGTTRTCVPTWQNEMQGFCNDLLNGIQTNVNYYNDPDSSDPSNPEWVGWGRSYESRVKEWLQPGGFGGRQRQHVYSTNQPPSVGIPAATHQKDHKVSWYHKRNFLLQLGGYEESASSKFNFPGTKSVTGTLRKGNPGIPKNPNLQGAVNVICAVNLHSQAHYRMYKTAGGKPLQNAWCTEPGAEPRGHWDKAVEVMRYFACDVEFEDKRRHGDFSDSSDESDSDASSGGSESNSKRDSQPIAYMGDAPIYCMFMSQFFRSPQLTSISSD
ncbi:hypothetical protein AK830_g3330 [Neonectria ditissima]|uniref:chitinase n=1 Tax=Neonectria ditissima TaxID=78410 RepID=A0A0P7B917_9HYPO|nr:hypothetical protein AK830_g3330 [Neonectria ditissima]